LSLLRNEAVMYSPLSQRNSNPHPKRRYSTLFAITAGCTRRMVPRPNDLCSPCTMHITGEYVYVARFTLTSAAHHSRFLVLSAPHFARGVAIVRDPADPAVHCCTPLTKSLRFKFDKIAIEADPDQAIHEDEVCLKTPQARHACGDANAIAALQNQ